MSTRANNGDQPRRQSLQPMESFLPSNPRAEEGIIAHLLAFPRAMARVQDSLTREDFTDPVHAEIFDAALFVYRAGRSCTLNNIIHELDRRDKYAEIETPDRVSFTQLTRIQANGLVMDDPLEDYARNLKETMTQRRLAIFGYELYQASCRRELGIIDQAVTDLQAIAQGQQVAPVHSMAQVMHEFLGVVEQRRENFFHEVANGIPTGFPSLDGLTGGLQPDDLIILAARPGFGKTAAALNVALNVASHTHRVLFVSREMSRLSLAQRLVAMDMPMDQSLLRIGNITNQEMRGITETAQRLAQMDFRIDEKSRTIAEICTMARLLHYEQPLDLIIVDYLQLIDGSEYQKKTSSREEIVSDISRQLKLLAVELHIPILALAQLNRAVEGRQNKIPQMSDLRESGAIEQNADIIKFLHVPEEQLALRQLSQTYWIEVIVAKHRNGALGQVALEYRPRSTKFVDPTTPVIADDLEADA